MYFPLAASAFQSRFKDETTKKKLQRGREEERDGWKIRESECKDQKIRRGGLERRKTMLKD